MNIGGVEAWAPTVHWFWLWSELHLTWVMGWEVGRSHTLKTPHGSSFHRSTLQHRQEVGDVSLSSRDTSSLYLPPPSTAAYTQPDGKPAGLRIMEITSEGMIMELPVPSPPFTLATGRLKRDQPKVRSYTVDIHVPTSWTSLPDLNIPSPGKLLKSPAAILRE